MKIEPATLAQVKTARSGRMVVVDDDVQGVARDLRAIDPDLQLHFHEGTGVFMVIHVHDGREQLVLSAQQLDQRIANRVREIASETYDYLGEIERIDAAADAAHDAKLTEMIAPIAERMSDALRRDTLKHKWRAFIP